MNRKREEILEYRLSDRLNQSNLKEVMSNPAKVGSDRLYYQENPSFIKGDIIDYMLLRDDFEEDFHISELEAKPSDLIMSMVQQCVDNGIKMMADDDGLAFAIEAHNYQPRWNMNTKIKKVREEGRNYYKELKESEGKRVISQEERIIGEKMKQSILSSKFKYLFEDPDRIMTQVPIYFEIASRTTGKIFKCKALLDIVYKEMDGSLTPIDLKSMGGSTKNFRASASSFRYDIQGAWYSFALAHAFPEKVINNFKFLVESTTNIGFPTSYRMTDLDLKYAWEGKDANKYQNKEGEILDITKISQRPYRHYGIWEALDTYELYDKIGFDQGVVSSEQIENSYELELALF